MTPETGVPESSRSAPLAAVVLAGGASVRMGQDKAALDLGGTSMLARVVERLASRCAPIAVVASPRSPAHRLSADTDLNVHWVTGEQSGRGPLAGLAAGLADAADAGAAVAFVCATDMPLLEAGLVEELHAALGPDDDVAVAVDAERVHPLAAVYRTRCAPLLHDMVVAGERRLTAALDALTVHRVAVSDTVWLTNVNAPEDLHRLRVHLDAAP